MKTIKLGCAICLTLVACANGVDSGPLPAPLCAPPEATYKSTFYQQSGTCGFIPEGQVTTDPSGHIDQPCAPTWMDGCQQELDKCPFTIGDSTPPLVCTISSAQFGFSSDGAVGSGIMNLDCGNCTSIYSVTLSKE